MLTDQWHKMSSIKFCEWYQKSGSFNHLKIWVSKPSDFWFYQWLQCSCNDHNFSFCRGHYFLARAETFLHPVSVPRPKPPGKVPRWNLLRKITPQRKTFGSFTSPTILHNLFHPGKNTSSLAVTIEFLDFTHHWIYGFHQMSFDITPVILLILLGVWQHLTGITAMRGNSSSRVLG